MKLIINLNANEELSVEQKGKASVDTLVSILLCTLESVVSQTIKKGGDPERLYDLMDTLFYHFMERVFPDIQPRDFDFSDAALLYAQDLIIDKAEKEGKTFEEAMKDFEAEARAYVNAQKGRTA